MRKKSFYNIKDMQEENRCRLQQNPKFGMQVTQRFKLERVQGPRSVLADVDFPLQHTGKPMNLIPSREEIEQRLQKKQAEELLKEDELEFQVRNSIKKGGNLDDNSSLSSALLMQCSIAKELPQPKSKYCAVCKQKFANYYQHILEPQHISNFQNDARTVHLQDFITRQKLQATVGFQKVQEIKVESLEMASRRPGLEEYKKEVTMQTLGVPQKRKGQAPQSYRTLRGNGNNASSTNIFQFSLSENPASFRRS